MPIYRTYDQADEALRAMEADVEADMGPEAVEAGFYDLVQSVALECAPAVKAELLRRELGLGVDL